MKYKIFLLSHHLKHEQFIQVESPLDYKQFPPPTLAFFPYYCRSRPPTGKNMFCLHRGGVLPNSRLIGMSRWMEPHFHHRIDGLAHFQDFGGQKIQVCRDLKIERFTPH